MLEDGVDHLVDQGLVDPSRVCVVGTSFGGYSALAASLQSSTTYRCAVSVNGFSDPKATRSKPRRVLWLHARNLFYNWSLPGKLRYDSESSGTLSLSENADQIETPVLLLHAEDDSVIPATQSRELHEALIRHKKDSEFVELPGHDHWLSTFDTRLAVLQSAAEFMEKHLGGPSQDVSAE